MYFCFLKTPLLVEVHPCCGEPCVMEPVVESLQWISITQHFVLTGNLLKSGASMIANSFSFPESQNRNCTR